MHRDRDRRQHETLHDLIGESEQLLQWLIGLSYFGSNSSIARS